MMPYHDNTPETPEHQAYRLAFEALFECGNFNPYKSPDSVAQSQAISLKRIADTLGEIIFALREINSK
jgi:hypothetical protein